jgi:peptide deformylase
MELLHYPHPSLTRRVSPVTVFDAELKHLVDEMTTIMLEHSGIGLAANQIGLDQRIIIYRDQDQTKHLINPESLIGTGDLSIKEGCLSFPGIGVEVKRFKTVCTRGFDVYGQPIEVQASGITAICLQHEYDHLEGLTFLDRLPKLKRDLITKKLRRGKGYG